MAAPAKSSRELRGLCVRRFGLRDRSAIGRILAQSPEAAQWSADSLDAGASSHMMAWVAELNGRVEGFLVGRLAGDEFEILNMAVSRARREQGIGSGLVARALEWAREAGGERALLEVRGSNQAAIHLYLRHGFTACGRRKQYYSNPVEDALLFARTLVGPI